MKKLFLFALLPVTIFFTSCLGNNKDSEPTGVEEGIVIYNMARPQVDLDLDPMILALKLNTLIVTAEKENKDYSTVTVTIGEGDDAKTVNLMEQLFGKGNEVTKSGNEWILKFNSTTRLEKEKCYRLGEVVINTYGRQLGELYGDPSYKWEVETGDSGYDVVFTSGDRYVDKMTRYTISAGEEKENTWVFEGHSASYLKSDQNYPANWNFSYELYLPGEASFLYNDILNSTLYMKGYGEGIVPYYNLKVSYTAEDLKYKPRCYYGNTYGGNEYVELERSAVSVDDFPEVKVKYGWYDQSSGTPCSISVIISYNGISVSY